MAGRRSRSGPSSTSQCSTIRPGVFERAAVHSVRTGSGVVFFGEVRNILVGDSKRVFPARVSVPHG